MHHPMKFGMQKLKETVGKYISLIKALTQGNQSNYSIEAEANSMFKLSRSNSSTLSEFLLLVVLEDSIASLTQKTINENNLEHSFLFGII